MVKANDGQLLFLCLAQDFHIAIVARSRRWRNCKSSRSFELCARNCNKFDCQWSYLFFLSFKYILVTRKHGNNYKAITLWGPQVTRESPCPRKLVVRNFFKMIPQQWQMFDWFDFFLFFVLFMCGWVLHAVEYFMNMREEEIDGLYILLFG